MRGMQRAIKNEATGQEVRTLSKWLHSSGKWRSMVSAVESAAKAAKKIQLEISEDDQALSRNDPKVQRQLQKANEAMKKVRLANDAYLQRKMREKGVDSPEKLKGRGKHDYEQKRIDYALKLRESIKEYDRISNPESDKEKAEQTDAISRLQMTNKRREMQKNEPQPGML